METLNNGNLKNYIPGYQILEALGESAPNIVYSAVRESDGKKIVVKTLVQKFPLKEDLAALNREYELLKNVSIEGVVKVDELVKYGHGNLAIIMENSGISLSRYLQQLSNQTVSVDAFYNFAVQLVSTLGQIHDAQIIHKDLVPNNIIIDQESKLLKIIDFSSSSQLIREHQEANASRRIEGSLQYISPEQTGRMNRDIDYRTDYYSLGVSFYQMLTGRLPFESDDALELVHCHISKKPLEPRRYNKQIPVSLSNIILKLMSKNAEDRYQSSRGILFDLELSRNLYRNGDYSSGFELAGQDVSRRFSIPQKLYGRDEEMEVLESCFKNASSGSMELALVSGYSGVGKSVLVHELGRSIAMTNGFLVHGKFDQFRQNTAYFAFTQAIRELVRQLLGENEKRLEEWRRKIISALGNNAQLMVDLIPELDLIIGPQPQVPSLSPEETQNRFFLLFIEFLRVFASPSHPLVIFLDDLQWSDIPSLNLLSKLVTASELDHILIIGAYRDNEVDTMHPLTLTLDDIEKKRYVQKLKLNPLGIDAVNRLVSDTLLTHPDKALSLSQILFEKTNGNPFFTIELLKNLYERDIIFFDAASSEWMWDSKAIDKINYSDNVIDIIVSKMNQMEDSSLEVLQLAACIGSSFDLNTLSVIHEKTPELTARHLDEALASNMIVPLSSNYKFVGFEYEDQAKPQLNNTIKAVNSELTEYKFQHDRIQQAAYQTVVKEDRDKLHLSIGKLMLNHKDTDKVDDQLITIVAHINHGRHLIEEVTDKLEFAKLNLEAGIRAKESSAYDSALEYLKIADELYTDCDGHEDYKLFWELSDQLQQCYYLTGDWVNSEIWADIMLKEAKSDIEKALVFSARTRQYATIGKMKESIEAAYKGLAVLGFKLKDNPQKSDVEKEIKRVSSLLAGRQVKDLINEADISDKKAAIASQLLMEIFAAAFLSGSGEKFPYVVLNSVNIALEYGNSPEVAFNYAAYGMLLCGYFNDPITAYEFGQLAVKMIDKYDNIALKSRIIYVYTMFVHHWSNHWSTMTSWFKKGIESGYQSGDLLYLAYSAQDCVIWDPRLDLETASEEHSKMLSIVRECDYQDSLDSGTLFLQMQLNFQGETDGKFSLTNETFNEAVCVRGMKERHFMTGIANYNIYKAEIHLMYNDFVGALGYVLKQEELIDSVMSLPQQARFYLISFLCYVQASKLYTGEGSAKYDKLITDRYQQMIKWAAHCPDNFKHLEFFMKAELAALRDQLSAALLNYKIAIEQAGISGFRRDAAMINEFAGRYLLRQNLDVAAEGYLQAAYYGYYQWGAHRKVLDMKSSYKSLSGESDARNIKPSQTTVIQSGTVRSSSFDANLLDISSIFKASQKISGELQLDNLLDATLHVLLENAGAQEGRMLIKDESGIKVMASLHVNGHEVINSIDNRKTYPDSLVNRSFRTNSTIVIDNASNNNEFLSDPYIKEKAPLSIICVPLPRYGNVQAAVYMENNLTHSAFTKERVEVIKLLAAQAAISMENARIYEEQQKLLKAQKRFVPVQFLKHLGHEDIAKVELGESVSINMSVMFSDIREFTPLVEALSPQEVIKLLNSYYSRVGVPISEYGGFIDSYAGDQIMALFAVPPVQAVRAGIKMSNELQSFNAEVHTNGWPQLNMGIGLNSGPLVLGTMGGKSRMQCTVLGDTVNLSSRIEQLTKTYGSQFLIGENTLNQLGDDHGFSLRMVDYVAVKGKDIAVKLYEVLDAETEQRRIKKEASADLLQKAMDHYYNRAFEEAAVIFQKAAALDPDDRIFQIYISRCENYINNPPALDWKGFEKLSSK